MLRSAAKGRRIVVSLPQQRAAVLAWLAEGEPDPPRSATLCGPGRGRDRRLLPASARYHSHGRFDGVVARRPACSSTARNAPRRRPTCSRWPPPDPSALDNLTLLAGTEPSYNNLAEVARQIQTLATSPPASSATSARCPGHRLGTKHGNACGAAVGESPSRLVRTMVMGDPRAIFGGLVMLNFAVTKRSPPSCSPTA